jgi:hypothetical protein
MKPTENLSRNTEAVADSLVAMIKKELTIYSYKCIGYLDPSDTTIITVDDRMTLVDWCYDVVDHCHYSRETVASAMEMVDRFLSMPSNSANAAQVSDEAVRDQIKFQLLTIAALYISIKINEKRAISSVWFAKMSRGVYTAEEIEDMERTLLSGISWQCHAPTASQVGFYILSLILPKVDLLEVTWGFLMDEMKYLTELAVREYYFSTQRTSTVALAAIINASNELDFKPRQDFMKALSSIFVDFGFEDFDRLIVCKNKLARLIGDAPEIVSENEKEEAEEDDAYDIQ